MKPNLFSEKALMEKAMTEFKRRYKDDKMLDAYSWIEAFKAGDANKVSELRELLEKKRVKMEPYNSNRTKQQDGALGIIDWLLAELDEKGERK